MQLTITTDFPQVQRKLAALQADIGARALSGAVNKTLAQGQTEMGRAIGEEFNLARAKIREKLFVRRAGFKAGRFTIEGALESRSPGAKRRAINLINFAARETAQGLSVKIKRKGGRAIASTKGFIGNKGRTAFKRVGNKRLPIAPLQTIDVPQMFNTRRINQRVVRKLREVFPRVFERELAFYLQRFGKK
jgi:hypothetical protein